MKRKFPAFTKPTLSILFSVGSFCVLAQTQSAQQRESSRYNPETPEEVINALFKGEGLYSNFNPADEAVELRNHNTKHFRNPDGTMTAVVGSGDLHYWENGKWKEILSHILPNKTGEYNDYEFASVHNSHKIYFPETPGKPIVSKVRGEIYEDWREPAMAWLDTGGNVLFEISANISSKSIAQKDSLVYPEIFPNTDAVIVNSVTAKKLNYLLKNSSVLANMPAGAVFLAFMETIRAGSSWKLTGDESNEKIYPSSASNELLKNLMFSYGDGKAAIEVKMPLFYEYKPPRQGGGIDTLPADTTARYFGSFFIKNNHPEYKIYTLVPVQWLTHPNRDFPLIIDPTTNYYPDWVWTYEPTYTTYRGDNSGNFYCTTWGTNYSRVYEYDISYGWTDDTWPTANPYFDGYATFNLSSFPIGSCITSVTYYWYKYYSRYCSTDITLKFGMAEFNQNLANEPDCNTIGVRIRNNNAYYNGTGNNGANGWYNQAGSTADLTAALPSNQISIGWAYNGGDDCCTFLCSGNDGNWHNVYGTEHSTLKPYVSVTYNTASTAASSATASINPTCPSQSTTLSIVGGSLGTGANWQWYSGSCGVGLVGSGFSISVSPASTTTYYVRAEGPCNTTSCVSVVVNVTNTNSTAPTVASASVNPTCGGATTLSASGGTDGTGSNFYWYTGGCGVTFAGTGSPVVSPASTTTYYVRREGTCNTTTCVSVTVTVNTAPTGVSASANPNPICEGATLNLTGGATGATGWSWTGPNGFTSSLQNPSIPGITTAGAGVYTLTASNSCGPATGANTASVTVNTVPASVTASANPNPICEGATLNLTGGATGATSWGWTGPNGFTSSVQNPSIPGITTAGAGVYTLTASNSCGPATGANTASVTVNPVPSTPTATNNSPLCEGATLNLTTPFLAGATYSWTGPNAFTSSLQNPSISGVVTANAGTYSVTVTVSGCTSTAGNTTVTVNSPPVINSEASTDATSCGANDGTITITASGTPPLQYSIDGGSNFSGSGSFTGLSAGSYPVVVTDANGCTVTGSTLIINDPGAPAAPVAGTNATYCDGDPAADLTATGSNIEWFSDPGLTNSLGTGSPFAIAPGVGTTTYYVTQTVSGCQSPADSVVIVVNPIATSAATAAICQGDSILLGGAFQTTTGNYNDTILGGSSLGCDSVITTALTVNPVATSSAAAAICQGESIFLGGAFQTTAGNYNDTVLGGSSLGCDSVINTALTVNPIPSAPTAGANATYCEGASVGGITATGTNIEWFSDLGLTNSLGTGSPLDSIFPSVGTTTYYVTQTVSGCQSQADSVQINIVAMGVIAGFNAFPATGEIPLEVLFTDASTGAGSWLWDFGDGTTTSALQNPTHIYNDTGLFNVILTVFDPLSVCTDTASVSITAIGVREVFIPDIFSPNGDGENDVLYVRGKGIKFIYLWIYDRWGELVFESTNIDNGWDGKYKGKEMNAGVFVYRLEVTFLNGEEVVKEGDITLVR